MRFMQHKKEAYWFYSFLSIFYDKYVNPFFWTESMRDQALLAAKLDNSQLKVIDVGSGTGFSTLGVVKHIDNSNVTCVDQSPHQQAKAKKKQALEGCKFQLGDAEDLQFASDSFDRYVSAGSIEYWPNPYRGISESYRVLKPGGIALQIGPIRPKNLIALFIADMWMLFPDKEDYLQWYRDANFTDIHYETIAPDWIKNEEFAIVISGVKPQTGAPKIAFSQKQEQVTETGFFRQVQFMFRVLIGSIAGFLFLPIAIFYSLLRWKKFNKQK